MKVVVKSKPNIDQKIFMFFEEHILPILDFGIAFENYHSTIQVIEKVQGKENKVYEDPTAEVVVELTEKALALALDPETPLEELKQAAGKFFDEALAIREIEKRPRPFSVEYYTCRYSPATQ